jgi:hypothetical protein
MSPSSSCGNSIVPTFSGNCLLDAASLAKSRSRYTLRLRWRVEKYAIRVAAMAMLNTSTQIMDTSLTIFSIVAEYGIDVCTQMLPSSLRSAE